MMSPRNSKAARMTPTSKPAFAPVDQLFQPAAFGSTTYTIDVGLDDGPLLLEAGVKGTVHVE